MQFCNRLGSTRNAFAPKDLRSFAVRCSCERESAFSCVVWRAHGAGRGRAGLTIALERQLAAPAGLPQGQHQLGSVFCQRGVQAGEGG